MVTADLLAWARECAASADCAAESPEYLECIADWRKYWRPDQVRVLLIAESHVAEQRGDLGVRVRVPILSDRPFPSGFCRVVYCLGSGESQICDPRPSSNNGTWQFWDLFGTLTGDVENRQPRKRESTLLDRLQWKVRTLKTLHERGIWLVDAAAVAFYVPGGGRRFAGKHYDRVLRESFERFVWPLVAGEPIELTCIIGRGVASSLQGIPSLSRAMVISQPQDRNATQYREGVARLRAAVTHLG